MNQKTDRYFLVFCGCTGGLAYLTLVEVGVPHCARLVSPHVTMMDSRKVQTVDIVRVEAHIV